MKKRCETWNTIVDQGPYEHLVMIFHRGDRPSDYGLDSRLGRFYADQAEREIALWAKKIDHRDPQCIRKIHRLLRDCRALIALRHITASQLHRVLGYGRHENTYHAINIIERWAYYHGHYGPGVTEALPERASLWMSVAMLLRHELTEIRMVAINACGHYVTCAEGPSQSLLLKEVIFQINVSEEPEDSVLTLLRKKVKLFSTMKKLHDGRAQNIGHVG